LLRCEDAREPLMKAALDPAINVRLGAVFPLLSLTPRPEIELDFWRRLLADPALKLEEYAVRGLMRLTTEDAVVAPMVAKALRGASPALTSVAVDCLAELADRGSVVALDALAKVPRGDAYGAWMTAWRALVRARHPGAPTVEQIVAELGKSNVAIALLAQLEGLGIAPLVAALGSRIGPQVGRTLAAMGALGHEALLGALDDPRVEVRRQAIDAFVHVARSGTSDLPRVALERALADPGVGVFAAGTRLLVVLGDPVDRLTVLLDDRTPRVRHAVVAAGRLGPAASPAVAALVALLAPDGWRHGTRDPRPTAARSLRRRIAHALGEIGSGEEALIGFLADPYPDVRRTAAHALGRLLS
jgi:HEAT repeat protein